MTSLLAALGTPGACAANADHATREQTPSEIATLARARIAAGGPAWDRVHGLSAVGRIRVSGLSGTWSRIDDVSDGRSAIKADLGVYRTAEGSDGRTHWRQEPSGGVHPLDGRFAKSAAVTDAWLTRRGWLRSHAADAKIGRAFVRTENGHAYVVVEAVPRGGQAVQLWFDARTYMLDRTVRTMPISIQTVRYGDYRSVAGLRLPFSIESRDSGTSDVETVSIDRWSRHHPIDNAAFAAPAPPDDAVLDGETTVPLDIDGLVVVEATLNGRALHFILDSGGHNILTPEAAKALGVRPVGAGASGGAGAGELPQQYVRIDRLDIGAASMRDQHFYVLPFQYGTIERGTREPLAGLLGLELFERFAMRIDYPGRALTLKKLADYHHRGSGIAVPITFDDDMPLLEGRIDGIPALLALDTGNASSLVIQPVWARQHGLSARLKRGIETVSYGAGGASPNWASRIEQLEIGGTVLPRPIVRYAEDTAGAFSSRTEAANIGTDVLSNFALDFDYGHSVIWFEYRPGYVPRPFNRAGIRAVKEGLQSFRVALVTTASPAAAAGLARDDEIVAVDGTPAAAMSGRDLAEKFVQPVGTDVALTIRRGGSDWIATVRLAEMLP
jgi:predicted aspartyl protease